MKVFLRLDKVYCVVPATRVSAVEMGKPKPDRLGTTNLQSVARSIQIEHPRYIKQVAGDQAGIPTVANYDDIA
jgi:hypothetical protein